MFQLGLACVKGRLMKNCDFAAAKGPAAKTGGCECNAVQVDVFAVEMGLHCSSCCATVYVLDSSCMPTCRVVPSAVCSSAMLCRAVPSGAEGAFLSSLVSELKKSGSLSLSALATKVSQG